MPKSLLEKLPEIVAAGRKTAERILESIESRQRVTLQTREVVLPAKDSAVQNWVTSYNRAAQHATADTKWTNRLIYDDNLLAMAALIAGDEQTPSRSHQPRRCEPAKAVGRHQQRTAGADRILGGGPGLRRQGVPLGVAGLPGQHGERLRRAARCDASGADHAAQNRLTQGLCAGGRCV
jgi:hypothetical protein